MIQCNSVYITKKRSMKISVSFRTSHTMAELQVLVDSGATDNFISPKLLKRLRIGTKLLASQKKIWNIDGTENRSGMLSQYTDLEVRTGSRSEVMRFLVTDLGIEDVILGYTWLAAFEPKIYWKNAVIDEAYLPVVIRSLDQQTREHAVVLAYGLTDSEKAGIVEQLNPHSQLYTTISTRLAQEAGQYTKVVAIPPHYQKFAKVFSEQEAQRFPPNRPWDHAIELKEGAPKAINCKIYPVSLKEDESLKEWIKEQVAKGYIRPSKSPYASPFFFITKKDKKLRPVQDYRRLNEHTIRNQYPLPLITELIAQVKEAHVFTKFDIRWGYNNIRIKAGDEHKAAFKTKYGLYEPTVMFFGLTNSPATFQTMMNHIFAPLQEKHSPLGTEIIVYMDDILIASAKSLEGHRQATTDVLQLLLDHDLYLKPEKCVWESPRVDFLGLILEKGVTRMDPTKIEAVQTWPVPTTVKHVRSFMGFCNFYRPFIYKFAHVAKPLNTLTKKDVPWEWTDQHQQAFDTLRSRITSEPILAQPQLHNQFELEVDASGYALGAVLMQRDETRKRRPVAYFSSTLSEAERNYDIYDLELLAIVKALRHWRHYLAGSPHKIIIYTDHANLQYWRQPHKISRRIAREVLELSEFNVELRHIAGNTNGRADALSRRPDYDQGERDNQDVVVLPDHLFVRATVSIEYRPPESQDINILQPWIDAHNLKEDRGEWYKDGSKVVTDSIEIRRNIIRNYHDLPARGHPGIARTINLVQQCYWWPQLRKDVYEYVKGCADCQRNKVNTQSRKAPLSPIYPIKDATPFQTIAMDFIVKLPELEGNDSILTITDHDCTKMAIFIPCQETISAEGVALLFLKHVFPRFGVPSKVISDRDPRFTSHFMRELSKQLGIEQNISTAFHPRTDGQSERTNQWLEQYLRFWVNQRQDNWSYYLPLAEYAHNSWRNETTKQTPYETLMGFVPPAHWNEKNPSPNPQVTIHLEQWKKARKQAQTLMMEAQKRWAHHKRPHQTFQKGEQVWLDGRNLKIDH